MTAEPIAELPPTIGPYRVLGRLGRGGMGVVFRGEDRATGRDVALKTVRLPSERHLAAIRREIRALAQVEHPGVVRILDEGVQDSLPWYAMELLHGQTLRDHRFSTVFPAPPPSFGVDAATASTPLDDALPTEIGPANERVGPISPEALPKLLSVFRRLCDPLAFVHGEGLVHCDLKPENVFLCADERLVLVDFGLISRFGGAVNREVLDLELFVGTAEYMAPEQWEGKPVDARTDLYAVGCMLYECLTGQPPYLGPRKDLYKEHLKAPPPKARELLPWLPREVDELVQALLSKAPGLRPGSAADVAVALEALGAEAPPPGPAPRPYLFRPAIAGRGRATHDIIGRVTASDAHAQVVLLGGESGVGKTRLAMEAARMAKRGGTRVLTSECAPNSGLLAPLKSVLLAVADRAHRYPEEAGRLLGAHGPVLARIEPALRLAPGVAAQPAPQPLPAEAERTRLIEALLATLGAFARLERCFWLLDDLHWADPLTLDVLDQILARPAELGPIAILATFRVEDVPPELEPILGASAAQRLDLGRLNGRAVARMVADMLGVEPPEGFVQFLTAQSEGNPFFVAEYLRAAVGAGLLEREVGGQWRWAGGAAPDRPDGLELPGSLAALLQHRLDQLGGPAHRFADAAAVLGRELDPDRAASIAQVEAAAADAALSELLRKQILEETGSGRVRFSHDKIREVAYGSLDGARRKDLHRRAARILEQARAEGAQDVVAAALAHHWLEADEPAKAIGELDRAAEDALARGGYREATQHLERALELSTPRDGAPAVALAPLKRASWHQRLGETHLAAGQLEASAQHCEAALDLLDLPHPRSRAAWVRTLVSQFARQVLHRLLPEGAFVASEGHDALAEATQATGHMARVAFFENDPVRIVASSIWSINLAERAGQFMHAARNYSGLGWTFGLGRMHRVANGYFARARRVGEESQDLAGLIFCLTSEALYRIGRAELDAAEAALESCKSFCAEAQDPQGRELAETLLGHPDYFRGRFSQAIDRHGGVLESARARRNPQHVAFSLYCMGRAHIARGAYAEASAQLAEAAEHLEALTDQMSDITCTGLRTIAALRALEVDEARRLAELTERHIGRSLPTAFITLHGFEAVAEVALYDLRARGDAAARRHARRAVRRLEKTAGVFPVGEPRALLLKGRLRSLEGDTKGARKLLDRGLERAKQYGLRYEEACLISEIGRLYDERSAERAVNNRLAGRIFDELGCERPEAAYLDTRR